MCTCTGFYCNHQRSVRIYQPDHTQLDTHAADNVIIGCTDDGPSDDRADNYSISSHHQVIGRRRYRTVTATTSKGNTEVISMNWYANYHLMVSLLYVLTIIDAQLFCYAQYKYILQKGVYSVYCSGTSEVN